ncbi:GNAT family N-acetyltransferase [Paragemmobacter aquarius]|uniref:GNAT family N-acetyltransferase n=1 Tax=Paragemmobacter aquarius TaxID=2169400 RepID=UPI001E4425BD|nr:GNAT family N-acetyltransferase [Gemmobacter aquarius]
MRQVYGRLGGAWRSGVMQLAGGEGETGLFLIDGLCVQPQARGRGVGSALIEAICTEAAARGFNTVRLDVVDTNPRARSLYERRGFVLDHSTPVGPLGLVFGYSVTHTMVRYL